MTANVKRTAVAVFAARAQARKAVEDLRRAGFSEDQIGVASREPEPLEAGLTVVDRDQSVPEGAAIGAATGAGLGALWAVGVATIGLPALGPVLAGGVLASILATAAGGAAVGGILGALVGFGIPKEEARFYETEFEAGRTLVTVHAGERYDEALLILHRHEGYDMSRADTAASMSRTGLP